MIDRAEAAGIGVAVAGHALLLAALTLGFAAATQPPPLLQTPMEISFVEDVALDSAAPEPAQAAPASVAPEVGPPEEAAPQPEPLPKPAPPEPQAAPPPPRPEPRPQPKQVSPAPARPKAAQPASAARRPTPPARTSPAKAPQRPAQSSAPAKAQRTAGSRLGPDLLKGIGRDPGPARAANPPAATVSPQARASINSAIQRALVPCEAQPLPAPEASAIQVTVQVSLNRDGSLAGATVSRVSNATGSLAMYEQRMRDLALRVVRQCTPIRGLPPELYDVPRGWRRFPYVFDPRQ